MKKHNTVLRFVFSFYFIFQILSQGYSQFVFTKKRQPLDRILLSSCPENYFLKSYTDPDSLTSVYDMIIAENNNVLIVGSVNNTIPNDYEDGFIFKIDQDGNKLWEITLAGPQQQHCRKIIKLIDNNYLIAGYDMIFSSFFLMKINTDGVIFWRKNILNTQSSQNPGISSLKEDSDGSIYAVSFFTEASTHGLTFIKSDINGNIIYATYFKVSNPINPIEIRDMEIKDGFSYIVGSHMNESNPTLVHNGFLSKIDNSTGNLIWTKLYNYNGGPQIFMQIFNYPSDKFCILGQNTINSSDLNNLLICDTSGTVQSFTYFKFGLDRQFGSATIDNNGNILYGNYNYTGTNPTDLAMCLINPYSGIIWSKHFPIFTPLPRLMKILISQTNEIFCAGNIFPNKKYLFIGKFTSQAEIGCSSQLLPTNFGSAVTTPLAINFTQIPKLFTTVNGNNPPMSNIISYGQIICSLQNNCDSITLNGTNAVCNITDTLIINIIKNSGCFSQSMLLYDTSFFDLIVYANDTAKFIIKKYGFTSITAELITSCDTLSSSLPIYIYNTPTLDIGSDTTLCLNNSLILNAGSGFSTYLWQDGSTDSTYTVISPGIYWVEAKDSCNNVYRDSINVMLAPPISFDLGPDLTKCNNDSLTIVAPPGFLNYGWSPNYNIHAISGQTVIVFPDIDTVYKVVAEKTPGCFAYDSIRIFVNHSPIINLGTDTSFCQGNSIILDAGNNFNSYVWSTGEVTSQILAENVGIYSVIATDLNSCQSKDTLIIQNIFPNPLVTLPKDSLCSGSQAFLSAGNGFTNYLWNTGSTSQSIQVTTIGNYWVTVTDNHGCSGSDTTIITKLLPVPTAFLPEDTFLCNYLTMKLRPLTSYNNYLWSTGAISSSITISQPGTYWLQVIDNSNCIGKDSITINPKQCLDGFYIPRAFTPNRDGKNDTYRPFLFGNVINYRFSIYNRWGQKIFETVELQKGWDGKISGLNQDSNIYVWVCTYQFEGQDPKMEKGTFILIR